jgi:DNA-directed RNA polymerase specialized sigma24 family protein
MFGGGDGRSVFSLQCPGVANRLLRAHRFPEFNQFASGRFQMNKGWVLTRESFDALLLWLDPERDAAGRKYEEIRLRLIKIFVCRGCYEPEDLADETINRVSKKLKEIAGTYSGEPARYFYGVANKVHLEYIRRKPVPIPPAPHDASSSLEREHACLERCIQELTTANRMLVLEYYREEKRAKIDHRKNLADQLGIALNALRIRACRIRASLQHCVESCINEATA